MTEQQIDRERLRAEAAQNAPYGMVISTGETLALLDQLDQAEARIRHLEATAQVLVKEVLDAENARDESRRGKVEAEARIKAVRDVLDNIDTSNDPALHDGFADILHALEG